MTAVVVGLVAHIVSGQPGPAAIVIGNGLALSSTAVVLQVTIVGDFCAKQLILRLFCSCLPHMDVWPARSLVINITSLKQGLLILSRPFITKSCL